MSQYRQYGPPTALGALPGWSRRGDALTKSYTFKRFPEGIVFIQRVADIAAYGDTPAALKIVRVVRELAEK